MTKRLYVGNLSYRTGDGDLERLFRPFGKVTSARVMTDFDTRESKGFGFVDMDTEESARSAVFALNGKEIQGRVLAVKVAIPKGEAAPTKPPRAGSKLPPRAGRPPAAKKRKRPPALARTLRKPREDKGPGASTPAP